ncbi:MAG TPA: sister chromatid cohesion protein PDS5 [Clostridia bacterium]
MIEKIASNLGRNDEEPNISLAILLSDTRDKEGISEIVQGLKDKKKEVSSDCIKVLYEIGERTPELISEYVMDFIGLLESKNNRLVWGGMTALSQIVYLKHEEIFNNIEIIKKAYKTGSVITVDNAVSVLAKLCKTNEKYEKTIFDDIINHLITCRPKEVPQHSERAFICVNKDNSPKFMDVLLKRKESLTEAQKKRVDKLIKRIELGKYLNHR